jgi:murein DD-endopeptidase MepM/ murein hydrolase activator NlpD
MYPIPGVVARTVFGKRNRKLFPRCGFNTGVDFDAEPGTAVLAARPGEIRWVNFGAEFGGSQLAVLVEDGSIDFYGSVDDRPEHGSLAQAGQQIAVVSSEGALHFELLTAVIGWGCSNVEDPQRAFDWEPS